MARPPLSAGDAFALLAYVAAEPSALDALERHPGALLRLPAGGPRQLAALLAFWQPTTDQPRYAARVFSGRRSEFVESVRLARLDHVPDVREALAAPVDHAEILDLYDAVLVVPEPVRQHGLAVLRRLTADAAPITAATEHAQAHYAQQARPTLARRSA